jgi:glycine cleavage system H protein
MSYPSQYRYTREHEWIDLHDGVGTVGITEFAQQELGDVVFVELPDVGQTFAIGEEIGSIESVKAVAEIFAPVSGEVVEVNADVDDDPALVNKEPHDDGWLFKIRLSDMAELEGLMDAQDYAAFAGKG